MGSNENRSAMLVGVGMDNEDGQTRVTRGQNFHLVGGSHETHERMQEQCIKFNEKLDDRGKRLDDLEKNEFIDLAMECEMPVISVEKPDA